MKGIILAGGSGTRLYPLTKGQSKQLLAIHDKPMIYYPLSVLMLAGIRDILIISTPNDLPNFKRLFDNGNQIGLNIYYEEQKKPSGIAEAFVIGEKFIGEDNVCLILGDNIFYGGGFTNLLKKSVKMVENLNQALIFGYYVDNAQRYGVVENDDNGNVLSIEEKPLLPKSNYAIVGLYLYPNTVIDIAKKINPSKRGELEITTVNQIYLKNSELKVELLDKDFTWLDSGTHESMLEASNYIHTIEKRKGRKVACIEEIAFVLGYINSEELNSLVNPLKNNQYGKYLIEKVINKKQ
jgi:glucose-1-phosphate thymidylyltransferase